MNGKKQTAVEWLTEQIAYKNYYGNWKMWHKYGDLDQIIDQAKAMERKQIVEAFSDGNSLIRMTPDECEQYYNETFNSNTNHNKQQ